jgi:hypothetical protein
MFRLPSTPRDIFTYSSASPLGLPEQPCSIFERRALNSLKSWDSSGRR